jgi:hypothetical protein
VTGLGAGLGEQLLKQRRINIPEVESFVALITSPKNYLRRRKNFIGRAAPAVCKSTTKKVAAAKTGQQL